MIYETTDKWDEQLWRNIEPIYREAFPAGSKTRDIIKRMFERDMCQLHTASEETGEIVALALGGRVEHAGIDAYIVDYLAVAGNKRGHGTGLAFLDYVGAYAGQTERCDGMIVEVEAEPAPDNLRRVRFWERAGFRLTDYVHQYIWVPEPYRAMAMSFSEEKQLPDDGKALFRYIVKFHEKAYRK